MSDYGNFNRIGTELPPPAERNILSELESAEKTLSGLEDAIRVLRERISVVSVPSNEVIPSVKEKQVFPISSPVRLRISAVADKADSLLRMVGEILHMLDL